MSLFISFAIAVLYAANWSRYTADEKQLFLACAVIIAGGLAGMKK